ncbi:TOBE domain-containing protein, partial [bacterium]
LPAGHPAASYEGKRVILGIRPEDIADAAIATKITPTEANTVSAYVDVMEPLGYEYVTYLTVGKTTLVATLDKDTKVAAGSNARFVIDTDRIHIFDADTEAAIR